METYTFYQWWSEPVCTIEAKADASLQELLAKAREYSLGQRLDYYRKKSETDKFQKYLDECQKEYGDDPNWTLKIPRNRIKGVLNLPDLNDMLSAITYRVPNKMKEYPYIKN